jgi:hypothetical protein
LGGDVQTSIKLNSALIKQLFQKQTQKIDKNRKKNSQIENNLPYY